MTEFNSNNAKSSKKSFSDLTEEYYPFWESVFKALKIDDPMFRVKLCYNSKEWSNMEKFLSTRFFENELDKGIDVFIEVCDWNANYFEPMFRKLYRVKYDKHWRDSGKFKLVKKEIKSWAIKMSDLELINTTPLTAEKPENINKIIGDNIEESTEEKNEMPSEKISLEELMQGDDHQTAMTIRDLYCIIQNVPMSHKPWLNELVKQGRKWQNKN